MLEVCHTEKLVLSRFIKVNIAIQYVIIWIMCIIVSQYMHKLMCITIPLSRYIKANIAIHTDDPWFWQKLRSVLLNQFEIEHLICEHTNMYHLFFLKTGELYHWLSQVRPASKACSGKSAKSKLWDGKHDSQHPICAPDIKGGASQGRVCHVKGCKRLSITSSQSESSAFREIPARGVQTDDNPYRANANARPRSQISFLRVTRSLSFEPFWTKLGPLPCS